MTKPQTHKGIEVAKDASIEIIIVAFQQRATEALQGVATSDNPSKHVDEWKALLLGLKEPLAEALKQSPDEPSDSGRLAAADSLGYRSTTEDNSEIKWPKHPSHDAIVRRLRSFAKEHKLVRDDQFDGELTFTEGEQRRYTLTRLVQAKPVHRTETVSGGYPKNYPFSYAGPIENIRFEDPSAIRVAEFVLLATDTVHTERCNHCQNGTVSCGGCDGYGRKSCDETQSCSECYGSGTARSTSSTEPKRQCAYCQGSGRIACKKCRGTGSVQCGTCSGSGRRTCSVCDGTTLRTTYDVTTVRRTVESSTMVNEVLPEACTGKASEAPLSKGQRSGNGVPSNIPDLDQIPLKRLINSSVPGELLRELLITSLPFTRVDFTRRGKPDSVYILGAGPINRALIVMPSYSQKANTVKFTIAAIIGTLIIAALIAGYYFFGSGTT